MNEGSGRAPRRAVVVRTGTWLYDGVAPMPVSILGLAYDFWFEIGREEGTLEPGEQPRELDEHGYVYYVRFADAADAVARVWPDSTGHATVDEAVRAAEQRLPSPVEWDRPEASAAAGLAIGIELSLVPTTDGGRATALAPTSDGGYRPGWVLPSMTPPEQAGAPVWRLSRSPVAPGDRAHAVILPFPPTRGAWEPDVAPGAVLPMMEGPRVCGHGRVLWVLEVPAVLSAEHEERFARWLARPEGPV